MCILKLKYPVHHHYEYQSLSGIYLQMEDLQLYGSMIQSLCLNQCEFLHSQTLNPWAQHCQGLSTLSILNCGVIGDSMFVGEVPELMQDPFRGDDSNVYTTCDTCSLCNVHVHIRPGRTAS